MSTKSAIAKFVTIHVLHGVKYQKSFVLTQYDTLLAQSIHEYRDWRL